MSSCSSFVISGGSVSSAFNILLQNGSLCHMNIFCCRVDNFLAYFSSHSIYSLWVSILVDYTLSNVLFFCWYLFTALNSLSSFVASRSAFCAVCTSTLLVISLIFLSALNSQMIFVIILSLFMSLINCYFSLLSLYLHSFVLSLGQSIHSSAFSLCSY